MNMDRHRIRKLAINRAFWGSLGQDFAIAARKRDVGLYEQAIYRPFLMARDKHLCEMELNMFSEIYRKPPWEAIASIDKAQESLQKRVREAKWTRIVSRRAFKNLDFAVALYRIAWSDVCLALARVAVACEIYEREHGAYPDSLDALVPGILQEVPADPFDGAPVRYRRSGKHLVLWSVGRNGEDDGGTEHFPGEGEPDIVLELHAPKAPGQGPPAGVEPREEDAAAETPPRRGEREPRPAHAEE